MAPAVQTGLVVGHVQSGKTLSFTTVIGMARDNGFPIVVVIAGTKTNLLSQSAGRLAKDLDVESEVGPTVWRPITNPNDEHKQTIKQTIDDWQDEDLDSDERATLLITVLKQQDRLSKLAEILGDIDLHRVPALIIDDEADQAGMNNKVRQGGESTIYSRLKALRAALPFHTYLQYTATPQAPLLINIATALSPDFVHVLTPGDGYVGGQEFFAPDTVYAEQIPNDEVYDDDSLPAEPPSSLLSALRIFFVGLSATLLSTPGNGVRQRRSMLVHPSRIRHVHRITHGWLSAAIDEWKRVLKLAGGDPDRSDLVTDFRDAYSDLRRTETNLPLFEEVLAKLPRALRRTQVIEFNTNGRPKTPEIKWKDADGWILVGGQAVDRGFTVDSLTVTYMPRGVGLGNADAIQQRARFFGYKLRYLGLCRVYLEAETLKAFEDYVQHEEIMRQELSRVAETGESLKSWQRRFILSPDMRLCRSSIISIRDPLLKAQAAAGWFQQRGAELTSDLREENARAVSRLVDELNFVPVDSIVPRSLAQQHEVVRDVPLEFAIDFLIDYRFLDQRDAASSMNLQLELGEHLRNNPGATADIYRMRPNYDSQRGRTVDENGRLREGNFLQGRTGDGTTAYPGDNLFKASDRVTLQLHSYPLMHDGQRIAEAAPLIAIHVPQAIAISDWIVQIQEGQNT